MRNGPGYVIQDELFPKKLEIFFFSRLSTLRHIALDLFPDFSLHCLNGLFACVNAEVSFLVKGLPTLKEGNEVLISLIPSLHGPEVPLSANTLPVVDGTRLEPKSPSLGTKQGVTLGIGNETSPDGENEGTVFVQEAGEDATLENPVGCLPLQLEDFGKWHAGFFFDEGVEFDEGEAKTAGEAGAKACFSRSPEP